MDRWTREVAGHQNTSPVNEHNKGYDAAEQEYEQYFTTEREHIINSANKEFGVNCWSHSITRQDIDCIDCNEGKYYIGVTAFVKVELKCGVYHEELGYGTCCGLKSKILSISNARKEAAINGLRKAIQSFGTGTISPNSETSTVKGSIYANQSPITAGMKSPATAHQSPRKAEKRLETSVPQKVSPTMNQTCGHTGVVLKKARPSSEFIPPKTDLPSVTSNNTITNMAVPKLCETPSHSSAVQSTDDEEEERKLERKRKQRQKQEAFRLRFKQNQPEPKNFPRFNLGQQNQNPSEWVKVDEMIETLDVEEAAFISTQELDQMIQTSTVHSKSSGPLHRVPLLSSPPSDDPPNGWKASIGGGPRRLDMKKTLAKINSTRQ